MFFPVSLGPGNLPPPSFFFIDANGHKMFRLSHLGPLGEVERGAKGSYTCKKNRICKHTIKCMGSFTMVWVTLCVVWGGLCSCFMYNVLGSMSLCLCDIHRRQENSRLFAIGHFILMAIALLSLAYSKSKKRNFCWFYFILVLIYLGIDCFPRSHEGI